MPPPQAVRAPHPSPHRKTKRENKRTWWGDGDQRPISPDLCRLVPWFCSPPPGPPTTSLPLTPACCQLLGFYDPDGVYGLLAVNSALLYFCFFLFVFVFDFVLCFCFAFVFALFLFSVPSDLFLSYLSRSLADRWSTTVDFTTSFLHSLRFSAFRRMIFHSRLVHSLMLSSHRPNNRQSISQGQSCFHIFTCCHTETETAHKSCCVKRLLTPGQPALTLNL